MGSLRWYLGFCRRFTWQILVAVGLITLGGAFLALQLKIESDIIRLLPPSAPSVAGLQRLEQSYGGQIGRLTVVLEMKSSGKPPAGATSSPAGATSSPQAHPGRAPDELKRLADELAAMLRRLEGVERVETRRPLAFQKKYRLLFADLQDLRQAQAQLKQRIERAQGRANPLFVGLEEEDSSDKASTPPLLDAQRLAEKYPELAQSPYYVAENGRFLAFFVYPDFPPSNLARSAELVAQVQHIAQQGVQRVAAQGGPEIQVGLTGRYKKRVDLERMLKRDLSLSSSLALGVLLLFLWLYLRSFRATIVVLTPLVVGIIWTFAWASIAFGSLNIMTAFLGAVLMGLGIDYGIHFFSRFRELRSKMAPQQALFEVFVSTGRANIAAALSTICALGSLMISGFRAFYEFGVIAVGGLPLILLAYLLLFPCAVGVAERLGVNLTRRKSLHLGRRGMPPKAGLSQPPSEPARRAWWRATPSRRRMDRLGHVARLSLLLVVLAAAFGLPNLRFNQDFSVLQSTSAPSWELDKRINAMLGQSQTPTLILTDSAQGSARVVAELQRRKARADGAALIDKVVSLQTFVPDEQPRKRALLAQIARRLRELPPNEKNAEIKRYLGEIERVVRDSPISQADLPEAIVRQFLRIDAPDKGVVLVFPAVELSRVEVIDAWARVLDALPGAERGPGYDAISESFLLRDIVHSARDDALWMLGITLAGLLLLSGLIFRNGTLTSLQFGLLALALLVALGVNGLVGSDLNFMNIVALPVWLGLAVDASFHVLLLGQRIVQAKNGGEVRDYLSAHRHLFGAISVAYLTSMIGFGTLLFAQHSGLFSLGLVAVLGLGSILVVNLLIQIILVARNVRRREPKPVSPRRSA